MFSLAVLDAWKVLGVRGTKVLNTHSQVCLLVPGSSLEPDLNKVHHG